MPSSCRIWPLDFVGCLKMLYYFLNIPHIFLMLMFNRSLLQKKIKVEWLDLFLLLLLLLLTFLVFIFEKERQREKERERERPDTSGGGAERRRHRIWNRLQALTCQHRARRGAPTHKLWNHDLSRSLTVNRLSHPGTPEWLDLTNYREYLVIIPYLLVNIHEDSMF